MELVIDTNILYSYFWKQSFTRKVLLSQKIRLVAPEFALEEINKYQQDIMDKTKITLQDFKLMRKDLALAVEFIPLEEYSDFLKKALHFSPDPNDVDFFALALKHDLAIWSNDISLKKQEKVAVFSTHDLFDKFFNIIFPNEID